MIYAEKWRKMITSGISENEISRIVYEAGYLVHRILGPGLLESAYEECMFYELSKHNLLVEKQKQCL